MRNIFSSFIYFFFFFLNRHNMRLQREIETINNFTSSFFICDLAFVILKIFNTRKTGFKTGQALNIRFKKILLFSNYRRPCELCQYRYASSFRNSI